MLELDVFRNTCIKYTEQIQESIAAKDWEKLSIILRQRQLFFERFFSQVLRDKQKADVKEIIAVIQTEDTIFTQDLQSQKKKLEHQFLSIRKNRKSIKNYQS